MSVETTLRRFLSDRTPELKRLLVAVSGGVDSVALLLAAASIQRQAFELSAVHVNHQLRSDADDDEHFVVDLCASLGIACTVERVSLSEATVRATGVEAAARSARYAALHRAAEAVKADYIATAHHRRDQAETVLMRLLSGSGLTRLRGIREQSGNVIRPLLSVGRDELEAFVMSRGVTPRDDSMNRDRRFLRTRIREELLPLLRELNPRIEETLAETAMQASELELELDRIQSLIAPDATSRQDGSSLIQRAPFRHFPALFRRIIHRELMRLDPEARNAGAEELRRVVDQRGRFSLSKCVEAVADEETILLRRNPAIEERTPFEYEVTVDQPTYIREIGASLLVEKAAEDESPDLRGNRSTQYFELEDDRHAPFVVRSRRSGDRFHPLGLTAEKSLKEFLIDRKIAAEIRDKLPLLIFGEQIVWVAGVEISERFKVRGGARARYRVTLSS